MSTTEKIATMTEKVVASMNASGRTTRDTLRIDRALALTGYVPGRIEHKMTDDVRAYVDNALSGDEIASDDHLLARWHVERLLGVDA
jgi:hypothetical protein